MNTEPENKQLDGNDAKLPVVRSAYIVNTSKTTIVVIAENIADAFDKVEKAGYDKYTLVHQSSFDVLE